MLREGKGWGEERTVPFSLLLTIARGRGSRTGRGLLELLDGDFVDRPAAGAVDVVVLPPLDPSRLQSEIDLFPAQGEAPATSITAKLHVEIPLRAGALMRSIVPGSLDPRLRWIGTFVARDFHELA